MAICQLCKEKYQAMSKWQQYCPDCYKKGKEMKGGILKINMTKEETKKPEEKTTGTSEIEVRKENAYKVLDYVQNVLKVPDSEISKVLSRSFTIARKQLK